MNGRSDLSVAFEPGRKDGITVAVLGKCRSQLPALLKSCRPVREVLSLECLLLRTVSPVTYNKFPTRNHKARRPQIDSTDSRRAPGSDRSRTWPTLAG